MTGETTRVALAGFGAWGQMHAKAIGDLVGAEIVAVYCHSERSAGIAREQLPGVAITQDYQAMLAAGGFDAVNICVPNDRHAEFAVAALEAGANVFLEKPLGITLEQCDAVETAARRTGRLVALNHELRVSKQWGRVRAIAGGGDLGRVRYQHLSLFRHAFRQGAGGWRYDPARVGSWILEEMVHFFDLVLWYASENGKPARVRAFGNGSGADLTENFVAVLEWDDGAVAVLTQCLSGFEHHTLLEVTGEAGGLRTWWSGAQDRTYRPEFGFKVRRGGSEVEEVVIPTSGEVFELEANLGAAYEGFAAGRSILPPEEARVSVEVCLAAEEAYRTGEAVALDTGRNS